MEQENDRDTNCNGGAQYSHQRFGEETGRPGKKRRSGDHPNYDIVEIAQNIEKSRGDVMRLAVT